MNKQDYIDGAESALLHTYNRYILYKVYVSSP